MRKYITTTTDDLRSMLSLARKHDFEIFDSTENLDGEGKWHADIEFYDDEHSTVEVFSFNKARDNYADGVGELHYEIDPRYNDEMFGDTQDPCLNVGRSVLLANGEGWQARVATRGELRARWTDPRTGEEISNYKIFERYLTDDKKIRDEQEAGRLVFDNNNWLELEIYKTGDPDQTPEYLDLLSDDCVCYSYSEAYDRFMEYVDSPNWVAELKDLLTN